MLQILVVAYIAVCRCNPDQRFGRPARTSHELHPVEWVSREAPKADPRSVGIRRTRRRPRWRRRRATLHCEGKIRGELMAPPQRPYWDKAALDRKVFGHPLEESWLIRHVRRRLGSSTMDAATAACWPRLLRSDTEMCTASTSHRPWWRVLGRPRRMHTWRQ